MKHVTVESVNGALMDKIHEGAWIDAARSFGRHVKTLCDMLDALKCEIDVEEYTRVMYEATKRMENVEGGQQ